MPTISRLCLGFDEHSPPYRYLIFFKNQTGLLYYIFKLLKLTSNRVWGEGENAVPHPVKVQAPILKYGKRKKDIFRDTKRTRNTVSLFETPDFNYGVPHTLQPTPYTLLINLKSYYSTPTKVIMLKIIQTSSKNLVMKVIKIIPLVIIQTTNSLYPLVLTFIAVALEAGLIFNLIPEIQSSALLLVLLPILYFLWLFLFIILSIFSITILFFFIKKPKRLDFNIYDDLGSFIQFLPIMIAHRLMALMVTLPFMDYFYKVSSLVRNVVIRAYSPKVNIGRRSIVVSWLQDPDLTYIGDNVMIGSDCHIVAHVASTFDGKLKYTSEPIIISNNSTIGGNSRIAMGVKIDESAIVEVGSNVLPYTRIGCGEIWGGNPAIFLRKRNEYAKEIKQNSSIKQIMNSELKEIIASAIHLPIEEVTYELNTKNCMGWDSLATMSIAASIYDRFSIRIPAEEVLKLDSWKSIELLIASNIEKKFLDNSSAEFKIEQKTDIPKNAELLPLYDPVLVTQSLARRFRKSIQDRDKKIIINATFTAQPLASTVELWCQAFNIPCSLEFGEFNQLEQALLSPDSIFMNNPNGLNLILVRSEDLFFEQDLDGMIRAGQLLDAIRSYATRKTGLIVSNLPQAVSPFFHGKHQQVEKLRLWWQEQLERIEGIYILNFARVVEEIGRQNAHDASFEAIARAPYSQMVYQGLGIEITRLARGIFLPAKKVLVLDCDGILWGGIVSEDGIDGIALSNDHPGRSFRLFQEMLLDLKKRGIILTLVSKNEEADVWNVFDTHPEMVLQRADIAAHRINWKEKSANLRELAEELNLSLDSFVFVDDSPVERLEVETNSPEVTVVPIPQEPAYYVKTLSKLWCFDSSNITKEDEIRTEFLVQEQQRRESQQSITSLQSYLESLQLVVNIRCAEERDLPRVAQLTQKTNQFNLSLNRRSLPEVQDIHKSCSILVLNLKDRFGDYGLVGVAILKKENESLVLDTFLMSCRALGRGVEECFLHSLFDLAEQNNLKTIIAPYCSGLRNKQVKILFLKMGFLQKQSHLLEAEVAKAPKKPKHIKTLVQNLKAMPSSDIAPLRTTPDKVKICEIKLPHFDGLLSLNQGFRFFTE